MMKIPTDLKYIVEPYEHIKIAKGVHKTITHPYTVSCGSYYYLVTEELYKELSRNPIGGIKYQFPNGEIKTFIPYGFKTEKQAYDYLWKYQSVHNVVENYLWTLKRDTFLKVFYIKDINYATDNYIERCHGWELVYFFEEDCEHNLKVYEYKKNGRLTFLGEIKCLGCLYLDKPLDFSKAQQVIKETLVTENINDDIGIDLAILKHTLTRIVTPELVKELNIVYEKFLQK